MRRVLIFPLHLILTLIICSQAWGASAWYVFKDGDTIKYAKDDTTTEYKSEYWTQASAGTSTTLQGFFNSLQNNDIVYMKSGEFPTSNTIEITKDVSVYGGFTDSDTSIDSRTGTTTIDCGNKKQVITIGNISVTASVLLDGLTITKGNATNGGGVLVEEESTAIINNCTITGNTASSKGGGICTNQDAIVIIANCNITGNEANNGGGIYANTNTVADITNCTITGNKATESTTNTSGGGGLYIGQYSTLTLANCTIKDNEAKRNGGGFYTGTNSKLTITNCTVVNNSQTVSNGNGKEFYNTGRTIMTNTFVWNSTADKAIHNSGNINASYCAAPSGITGITANEDGNIAITSWGSQSSTTETVNGVTHTVYKIENNSELSDLEGSGTSEGAPEKDQLGNTRSSPPCIGAVEKVYTPALSPGTLTINAIEGKAIDSTTITATQGAGIVWSATGQLPAGLTAASSDNTCTISGVPETGTSANSPYNYTITATNSKGSDDVTVTVNVSAIPMLSYSDTLTLTEGEAMTDFKITAIAGSNLTWSTNDTLPNGLTGTSNDTTYTITGTPARGTAGTKSYTVTATSTSNTACTATATITITIKAAAEPTLLDSAVSYTAEEGSEISPIRIIATSGSNLTWSGSGSLPSGLTVSSQDNVFTISGTPAEGTASGSPYNYTVKVTNIAGMKEAQVTITVNEESPPVAPVFLDSSINYTCLEGVEISPIRIFATEGNKFTWSESGNLPDGLTTLSQGNIFTIYGTPSTGTSGSYTYTVKAANSLGNAEAKITITVKTIGSNSSPSAPVLLESEIKYTGLENWEISPIKIIAMSGNNLEWSSSGTLPEGLQVSNQSNVFTIYGTPATGTSGSYTYTVKAANSLGSAEAKITITIKTIGSNSSPSAPVLLESEIKYTGLENWEISPIKIIAMSGNNLEWSSSGTLPEGLQVSRQSNIFTIYGTPATGTSGSYTYTVKAANSLGNAEAKITITIKTIGSNSSPSAPVLLESEIKYTGLENWEISPIKIIAMSGNNLEWSSSGTLPEGLQVSNQSNIFTIYGTPATGTSGSYTYTVKAANSLGSAEAIVTITVKTIESNSSPSAPVLLESEINYTGLENWEISPIKIIAMSGNNLEWSSSGTLPEGLQVSRQSNIFTIYGTPATGTSGSYTYTVKAANSLGSAEAKITITVKTIGSNSSPSAPVLLESEIKYTGLENWEISPIKIIAVSGNNLEWSSSGTLPDGLQVSRQSNVFTIYGTPATGSSGSYSYAVKAANSLGSAEARIAITVKGSSAKPILTEPAITYINQEGYTIKPIIIKAATGDNLAWSSSGSLPAGLSGAESGDKTGYIISGILAIGTAGRYSCTVTAKNGIGEASTLVTIIVEAFELEGLYEPSENTNLEDYLLNTLDLSREQLYTITSLKVFANITSLHGIAELVPNLKTLDLTEAYSLSGDLDLGVLGDLELDEVDISGNPALKTLALRDCIITRVNAEGCENLVSIDVAGNESIKELILDNTNISTINARDCKNLITLHFADSRVTKMDLTGCDELQDLDFRANSVRRFHIDQFGLRRLETLDAAGQEVYVPLIEKVFNFAEFLTGYDNDYDAYSSGTTADTSDHNLGEVTAYDESGNEIDYDDSKYKQTGEFIFDKAPARIVYEYETGLTSMDVTITGTHDDDSGAGLGGSGGCNSGLANWALLALVWLVLNYQGGYTFL